MPTALRGHDWTYERRWPMPTPSGGHATQVPTTPRVMSDCYQHIIYSALATVRQCLLEARNRQLDPYWQTSCSRPPDSSLDFGQIVSELVDYGRQTIRSFIVFTISLDFADLAQVRQDD